MHTGQELFSADPQGGGATDPGASAARASEQEVIGVRLHVRSGSSPPLHRHPVVETFYAVEGEFEFYVYEQGRRVPYVLSPGTAIRVPRGLPHTYLCRIGTFGLAVEIYSDLLQAWPADSKHACPEGIQVFDAEIDMAGAEAQRETIRQLGIEFDNLGYYKVRGATPQPTERAELRRVRRMADATMDEVIALLWDSFNR
jgi:mannose-6-phosphate isomerase-like protein (cupin superfamily)